VDESSESVVAFDRAGCGSWRRVGCLEAASAVTPLVVVALEVLAEDSAEVTLVTDQEPVEALCAEHIDAAQQNRVDAEEVACEDPSRLGAEERVPGRPVTPRRRLQPGAEQHPADAAEGDADRELRQLADNPRIAPARVLARDAHAESADLRIERWPSGAAVGVSPASAGELAVPSKERRGCHDQAVAPVRFEHPSERREQCRSAEPSRGWFAVRRGTASS
jgi:hypothetical protein